MKFVFICTVGSDSCTEFCIHEGTWERRQRTLYPRIVQFHDKWVVAIREDVLHYISIFQLDPCSISLPEGVVS